MIWIAILLMGFSLYVLPRIAENDNRFRNKRRERRANWMKDFDDEPDDQN